MDMIKHTFGLLKQDVATEKSQEDQQVLSEKFLRHLAQAQS